MTGTPRSFDVLIAGGGPAGAAAAIVCAAQGLRTLILEKSTSPRQACETLHPGAGRLFAHLGVEEAIRKAHFPRHRGHVSISSAGSSFSAYGSDERGEWHGYHVERAVLDEILLARARASGARVLVSTARETLRAGLRVQGIRTEAGEFHAPFTIDAGGGVHWLQRRLGLPVLEVSGRLVARYGKRSQVSARDTNAPEFRETGCGWEWAVPLEQAREAWVKLRLDGTKSAREARSGGRDVTWRLAWPCAGKGYFLAGDAAFVLDPASSKGVIRALLSGIAAADAIVEIAAGKIDADAAQRRYASWLRSVFCADATTLGSLYSRMNSPPSWLASAAGAIRNISTYPLA